MKRENINRDVSHLADVRYWYQCIEVDGKTTPVFNREMSKTVFYNKGKWEHFIKPLIPFPPEGRRFSECGCNAGLFLLLAAEYGFSEVLGFEGDDGWYEQARFILNYYQECDPVRYGSIALSHSRLGRNGEGANSSCTMHSTCQQMDALLQPTVDITLLANVLYWIDRDSAVQYVHDLAQRSDYCIVVSVEATYPQGGPCSSTEVAQTFNNDWRELERILPPVLKHGEKVRDMFSILFQSKKRAPCTSATFATDDNPLVIRDGGDS